jgi:hypothetical protein
VRVPQELEDGARPQRVVIDGSLAVQRALDDAVEVERVVRHAERPDLLASAKLLHPHLERLEDAQPPLPIGESQRHLMFDHIRRFSRTNTDWTDIIRPLNAHSGWSPPRAL